ncbi:MAG: cytochrome c3 family protein [Chloroflexi bacterium]|nr:cytochrome c3 family protein [Chloroflexota bacterium]
MSMWKIFFALGIALVIVLAIGAMPSPVAADGGPHGGYRDTAGSLTDKCAACHRVHQGKSEGRLLKAESQYALCLTCHNGAGSRLNVLDGVKLSELASSDGTIARAVKGDLAASVAPRADLFAAASKPVTFTVQARNLNVNGKTGTVTVTFTCVAGETCTVGSQSVTGAGDVSDTVNVIAAESTTPNTDPWDNVGYLPVTFPAPATGSATRKITVAIANEGTGTGITAGSVDLIVKTIVDSDPEILNGGGFRFVGGEQVTSRHNADPADNTLRPWGYGGLGATTYLVNTNLTDGNNSSAERNSLGQRLQCTSCHNPHGTANYRLLKEQLNSDNDASPKKPVYARVRTYYITGTDGSGNVTWGFNKDEGCPGLGDHDEECAAGAVRPPDKYTREYYGSSITDANDTSKTTGHGLATLCGACHTAYPSNSASLFLRGGAYPGVPYTQVAADPDASPPVTADPEFAEGETVYQATSGSTVADATWKATVVQVQDGGLSGTLLVDRQSGTYSTGVLYVDVSGARTKKGTAGGAQVYDDVVHYRHRTEMAYTIWANPESGNNTYGPEASSSKYTITFADPAPDPAPAFKVNEQVTVADASGNVVGNAIVQAYTSLTLTLWKVQHPEEFVAGRTVTGLISAASGAIPTGGLVEVTGASASKTSEVYTIAYTTLGNVVAGKAVKGLTSADAVLWCGTVAGVDTTKTKLTLINVDKPANSATTAKLAAYETCGGSGVSGTAGTTGSTLAWQARLWGLVSSKEVFARLRLASKDIAADQDTSTGLVDDDTTLADKVVTCLTCHRVHGTASTMKGYAVRKSLTGSDNQAGKADEDLTPSQGLPDAAAVGGASMSTLLYTNNRGMCEACHQW